MKMNKPTRSEVDSYFEMLRDIDNDSKAIELRIERLENLYNGKCKD